MFAFSSATSCSSWLIWWFNEGDDIVVILVVVELVFVDAEDEKAEVFNAPEENEGENFGGVLEKDVEAIPLFVAKLVWWDEE